jgi:MFS family permease
MTQTPAAVPKPGWIGLRGINYAVAGLLVLLGFVGQSHAAIGYALFLIATLLLLSGVVLLGIFTLTRWFDTAALRRAFVCAFWMGAWAYVFAVASFIGYYVYEAAVGNVPFRFILFGPAVLAAIVVLDVGIYRTIFQKNLPTIRRFGDLWNRDSLDQDALSRTLVDEVVLHRSLFTVSPFRWVRHQLIFWGFGLMFLTEIAAVAFREAFPAFGWTDLWHVPDHPVRLAFDLAYDLTGLMLLVGCLLALAFRVMANGKPEQKYTDTPTTVFLLVLTVSGFMLEGARLGLEPAGSTTAWASFVGLAFVPVSPSGEAAIEALWIFHALAVCGFIAYIPLKRMIHSCATPMGRLANSQKSLLADKKAKVIAGLNGRFGRH